MERNFDLAPEAESLTFLFCRMGDALAVLGPLETPSEKQKAMIFELVAREGKLSEINFCLCKTASRGES